MPEDIEPPTTQKLPTYKLKAPVNNLPNNGNETLVEDAPLSVSDPEMATTVTISKADLKAPAPTMRSGASKPLVKAPQKQIAKPQSSRKSKDVENAQMVQERCEQLCLSLFLREQAPVRSLGFTSSLQGEGKSLLAMVTASVLARDSNNPVTLLECNWEHPCLHEHFGFSSKPGLAEWLRGECDETEMRRRIDYNLTVIPAGNAQGDVVRLLQRLRQENLLKKCIRANELLVVDLPSIASTSYGSLAAGLAESLVIVVRAGVTPDALVAETCAQLKNLPVHGLLLNQVKSNIPRWIRQIL